MQYIQNVIFTRKIITKQENVKSILKIIKEPFYSKLG